MSSTVAILVLLHFLVFTVPVKSLPLVALAVLLTYLHLFWCDATSRASSLQKINAKAITKQNGDRERRLVSSTLDFCSEIREEIAQEVARINEVSLQNYDSTAPQKITSPKLPPRPPTPELLTPRQLKPNFRQRSWSDDLSPSKALNSPESALKINKLKGWSTRRKVHSPHTCHFLYIS